MKSLLIIEHEPVMPTWRIVMRECTETGLSRQNFEVVGKGYRNLAMARWLFRELKYGCGFAYRPDSGPKVMTAKMFPHR